jgi:hypothetical protein
VPGSWVVAEQRVDEHVEVAAAVEEGAAGGSLELESALVGDLPAGAFSGAITNEMRLTFLAPNK